MKQYWPCFGLLALMAFAPGCGPDHQTLCEEREKCLGGNDADIDACVIVYDDARDNAYDIGCGEEYDLLVECAAPLNECNSVGMCSTSDECNGSRCVGGECKSYSYDVDSCKAEANAYSRCN